MQAAAQVLLEQIKILSSPPTNARNFMVLDVYGRGTTAPSGEAFKQTIYSGLSDFHTTTNSTKLNVSYVDFATIWDGVLGPDPGFAAFGYKSTDACTACTSGCSSTTGWCLDPDHYFYWISGCVKNLFTWIELPLIFFFVFCFLFFCFFSSYRHPSKETHRIMADFVDDVWRQCRVF